LAGERTARSSAANGVWQVRLRPFLWGEIQGELWSKTNRKKRGFPERVPEPKLGKKPAAATEEGIQISQQREPRPQPIGRVGKKTIKLKGSHLDEDNRTRLGQGRPDSGN